MVVRRGDVLIPLDRNPVETGLLVWAAWTGASRVWALLAGAHLTPTTGLRWGADLVWHLLLLLGATAALIGAYWTDAIEGVRLVRWAMWPLAVGCGIYCAGLVVGGQYRVCVPLGIFAAAFSARAAQITRDLRGGAVIRRPAR